MNRRIIRLDGLSSMLFYEDTLEHFITVTNIDLADKIVAMWNNEAN